MSDHKNKQGQISLELDEDIADGPILISIINHSVRVYCGLCQYYAGIPKAKLSQNYLATR